MIRYDLQVHTDASPCSRAAPTDVVKAAIDARLDGIAVTNHDTLEGYEEVSAEAPSELTIIPGVEVTTTQGHILALDVQEPPPQADPISVIDNIHDQGGIAVLSHPFDLLREHFTADLEAIASKVDAVEAQNSRCLLPRFNARARTFADQYDIPVTGGSDAHFPMEIGRSVTVCRTPVLDAIRTGQTGTRGRGGYLSGHFLTKVNDLLSRANL